MDLGLTDKIVIVTGGASGIGAAIVARLVDEGAVPVILDRQSPDPTVLRDHQSRCPGIGVFQLDLTDDAACRDTVDQIRNRYGRIDALVNNAGRNDRIGLSAGPDAFRASLNNNLVQVYTLTHLCLPHLRATQGAIVNIASKVAVTGQGGTSAYAAAKGGILALTREWAAELARDGIRVNAVVPAEVRTKMYQAWVQGFDDPAAEMAKIVTRIPLGARMTTTQEIANTVLFLLSDQSSHTTGQWLHVDGGYRHLDRAIAGVAPDES